MNNPSRSAQQAHRLIQVGLLIFLCALLVGLAVPRFAVPRLGLSAHLLGLLQGLFLMLVGLLWPRLQLGSMAARVAFWALVYGCLAAWGANLLGAIWGAGNTLLPMAAGAAHGSTTQEMIIAVGLRSSAVALIAGLLLLVWGARRRAQ